MINIKKLTIFLLLLIPLTAPAGEKVYKVAIDAEYAPYEFRDSDGRVKGFLPALLQEIGTSAGVTFKFFPMNWPDAVKSLESGDVDLLNMILTPERRSKFEFSDPHSGIEQALFRNKLHGGITDIDSISGNIVILQKFDIAVAKLAARNDFNRFFVNNKQDGFIRLNTGKAAAFLTAKQPGLYFIKNNEMENVELVQTNLWPQEFCFTAKKGNTAIISLLNRELEKLKRSGRYDELIQQWMTKPDIWFVRYEKNILISAAVIFLLFISILIWNRRLQHEVKLRRSAENKLTEQHNYLQSIVDGLHDPIMVIKSDYSIELMNSTLHRQINKKFVADPEHPKCYEVSHQRSIPCDGQEYPCPLKNVIASQKHTTVVHQHKNSDGNRRYVELSASPLFDYQQNCIGIIEAERDITAHLKIQDELRAQKDILDHQAHHDALTKLPNRLLALDRLSQHLLEADRNGKKVGVLFMDLDDFKKINDTLGHEYGDKILIEAAKRLNREVRDIDSVGRLGGDEFVILIGMLSDAIDVSPVIEKLLKSFQDSFKLDGRELVMTASIGVAIYPDDGNNASELLRNADSAMYHSKKHGRNTFSFFTETMNKEVSRRLLIEEQLHGALGRSEFRLCYQPQIDIKSRRIIGLEALLRWHNPSLGEVSPEEFIPIAEQTGLIISIGRFVLTEALDFAVICQKQCGQMLSMSINLSPLQFRDPELVNDIKKMIIQSELPAELLELEITEGVLMSGHTNVENALTALSQMNISIAMDDFGTGYSSLSYLRCYPFSVLKIDRSFIADITRNLADLELVNAAISMAHALGMKVIAEGVETEEQLTFLAELDCEIAQGYLFSKPVSSDKIIEML